jgi:DNA-binding GntR family transcriptional regulator
MLGENTVIRATTLHEQVFRALRKEILAGRMKPGEKLLEAEVAVRFGLSRNPVREAIAHLEQIGLVRNIPNRGTYVAKLSQEEAHDMLLLRAHFELLAVRLALHHARPGQFDGLEPIVVKMQEMLKQTVDWQSANGMLNLLDADFHEHLVRCSQSEALCRAWDAVAPCELVFAQETTPLTDDAAWRNLQEGAQNHVRLLDALRSGDLAIAHAGIRDHFRVYLREGRSHLTEEDFRLLEF